jgi:fucose permease
MMLTSSCVTLGTHPAGELQMSSKPDRLLLLLAYLGFVSLGLPDAVLGMAWPSLRATFGLSQSGLGWILAAGASGYFLSGLFAGRVLSAVGVGTLLAGSTALVVLGVVGYASAPSIFVFAAAAMIVGWGSGAVDAGLNTHASVHFAPGHMAWLHAAYSTGAALGSLTMAAIVTGQLGWRYGYAIVAALLAVLAAAFVFTQNRWSARAPDEPEAASGEPASQVGALAAASRGRVRLGVLLFFVYSGVEFGLGHWAFTILTEERGLARESAAVAASAYWMSLLAGRIVAGFVIARVGTVRLVRLGTVFALVGAVLFAAPFFAPLVNAFGLALVGAALAPIYPGLMSETPRRTAAAAAHAVGFQVSAATAGMVALPALGGWLADRAGLDATAALIVFCALGVLALNEWLTRVTRHAPVARVRSVRA